MADTLDVYFHEDVLSPRPPDGLFERPPSPLLAIQTPFDEGPDRIVNIKSVMERAPSAARFMWHDGRHATDDEILLFHTGAYLEQMKAWDVDGAWATDTTYLPRGGMASVRAAAGTPLMALERILDGSSNKGYAIVRPPGHHAAPDVADGYCFVNANGLAAEMALKAGNKRIAILDWDVHHGNGTQTGFYERDDVLFISLHMDHGPWSDESHPETGGVDEIGKGAGEGYNINLPLAMGLGDETYTTVVRDIVIPALSAFEPDLIIVSNGQDGNQFDPNGRQVLSMKGFHEMARAISVAADKLCDGRLLVIQEGGYNVAYVGFCAYATAVGFLQADLDLADPLAFYPSDGERGRLAIADLIERHPLLGPGGVWTAT